MSQFLNVIYEMPGRILFKFCVWYGAAAATLIEKDDSVLFGIVEATHDGIAAAAGPTMHHEHGQTIRVAAFLIIYFVQIRDLYSAGRMCRQGWKQV